MDATEGKAQELGPPSLIADDVHVKYKVFGGRRVGASSSQRPSALQRAVGRANRHVGAVSEVHAVRGVSFVAHQGESVGIIGRNGAGKSTVLRALAGLLPLAGGNVYRSGQCSLLGVNAALLPNLTGERNIVLGGLALGLTPKQIKERFAEIVDFAGIGDFIHLPMNAYSSGMSARLRFAISTAVVPDILMVDEALATGDVAFRKKSQERIEKIRAQAGTVFLVSHSARTVRDMCDRALWMDKGKLIMDGPVDPVVDAYEAASK